MVIFIKGLLEAAAFSSAMIAIVLGIRALFAKKLNIQVMSVLWVLVIVRLMLPVTVSSPIHISDWIPSNVVAEKTLILDESAQSEVDADTSTDLPDLSLSETVAQADSTVTQEPGRVSPFVLNSNLWEVVFFIWAAGVLAVLGLNAVNIYRFKEGTKHRKPVTNSKILKMMYIGGNKLCMHRMVRIYECDGIDSPVTCGVLRPQILLPVGLFDHIGAAKTELILFHEMAHIKQFDVLKNHLWLLAKIVYWFNPLVYLGNSAYLEDIELACDDRVLKRHSKAQVLEYTQGLLDVIRLTQGEVKMPTVISFCKDKSKIRKRVENMLNPKKKSKLVTIITIVLTMLLVMGCFTTACTSSTDVAVKNDGMKASSEATQLQAETEAQAMAGHIEAVLESDRYILNINAEVADFSDRDITVYNGEPMPLDEDGWIEKTFSGMTKSQLMDRYGETRMRSNLSAADAMLVDMGFAYEYIWPEDAGGGTTSLYYQPIWAYIGASSYYLVPQEAKDGATLATTPEQCEEAANTAYAFMAFVGVDDFYMDKMVKTLPEYNYYEFTFEKRLDGIPVLLDYPVRLAEKTPLKEPDRIQMFVRDNRVIDFGGYIRKIEPASAVTLISPDNLLEIIEKNMDEIDAFSSNAATDTERAEFDIDSIALKYYAVAQEDKALSDSQAYVTYIPVYVAASGIRMNTNLEYVMIIDAVTGAVLNKNEGQYTEAERAAAEAATSGSDLIAGYTGDYIDQEVAYINKITGEAYSFTADNEFYWLIDSQTWTVLETADITNRSVGYSEYIDINGWHLVNNGEHLVLYHDNTAVIFETDLAIFDRIAAVIKDE